MKMEIARIGSLEKKDSEKKNKKQNPKSKGKENEDKKAGEKTSKADKYDIISIGKLPKGTKYIYKNYSKEINDRIIHNIKVSKRHAAVNAKLLAKKRAGN